MLPVSETETTNLNPTHNSTGGDVRQQAAYVLTMVMLPLNLNQTNNLATPDTCNNNMVKCLKAPAGQCLAVTLLISSLAASVW